MLIGLLVGRLHRQLDAINTRLLVQEQDVHAETCLTDTVTTQGILHISKEPLLSIKNHERHRTINSVVLILLFNSTSDRVVSAAEISCVQAKMERVLTRHQGRPGA